MFFCCVTYIIILELSKEIFSYLEFWLSDYFLLFYDTWIEEGLFAWKEKDYETILVVLTIVFYSLGDKREPSLKVLDSNEKGFPLENMFEVTDVFSFI